MGMYWNEECIILDLYTLLDMVLVSVLVEIPECMSFLSQLLVLTYSLSFRTISFIFWKVKAVILLMGMPLSVMSSFVKSECISLTTTIFYLGPQETNLMISFSGTYQCR